MRKLILFLLMGIGVSMNAFAQDRTVSGNVTSSDDGSTLPGVTVVLKGTTTGTTTDFDGNYKLSVPAEGGILVFSFVGMATQEVEVGARSVIDLVMQNDAQQLSEVVVTAMGVTREKASIGYSVQEVAGDDVAKTREVNIVNALQGQVAGVQIQGTTGSLGGSSRITIRGVNSFRGENQPLFVVDGVPIDNRNFATSGQQRGFGGGAYDYGNAASDINPNDIETMSVLKGAAATSLYGSRGSNGVILITTKKGSKGQGIGVDFSSAVTFDTPQNMVPHQKSYGGGSTYSTPSGFFEFNQDGTDYLAPNYGKDGSWGPKYDPNLQVRHWDSWDPGASNYKETRPWVAGDNDYQSFFETGVTWNNSVSLSGATDRGSFRLGYSNLDQKGTFPNSQLDRNTVTLAATQKLSDRLKAEFSVSYVNTRANGRNATGYDNKNAMQAFLQWYQNQLDTERLKNYKMTDGSQYTWNPNGVIADNAGNYVDFDAAPHYFDNPYWVRFENLQRDERNRIFGNFALTYELMDGLSISGKAMRDGYSAQEYEGVAPGGVDLSAYSETTRNFNEMNYEGRITYNKTMDDLSISAFVGGNLMRQKYNRTINQTNGGLSLPGFWNLSNSVQAATINTLVQEKEINSVFGAASFGYKNIVFVDLTARNDWSSALDRDNRSFFYPGVTTSFVFSEVVSPSFLSFGKVRASWGQAGNDSGPYQLDDVFAPLNPNFGTSPRYAVPNTRNNSKLKNELTTEIEFGIEARFFDNRLGIDISYYDRKTEDQILNVASSWATGYAAKWVNAGTMRNKGIEMMIDATPVSIGDFQWNIGLNFATYDNTVEDLAEGIESIPMGGTWAADLRIVKGEPYMSLYGDRWERHENGQPLVDATTGAPIVSADGRVSLGSAIPDYTGGLRNTFTWKGLNVSALIDFQEGGIIHSTSLQWANYSGMSPESVWQDGVDIRQEGYLFPGVTPDGAANTVRMSAQGYFQGFWNRAEPNVYSASFVKLREVSISYTVPNSAFKGLPFRDLTIGAFGRNLAILSSDLPYLDPQAVTGTGNRQGLENAQVPTTRSIGFNLSFKL